jgi:hypothetical protein
MAEVRRAIPVREDLAQRVKVAAVIGNTSMFALMNDLIEKNIPQYDHVDRTPATCMAGDDSGFKQGDQETWVG